MRVNKVSVSVPAPIGTPTTTVRYEHLDGHARPGDPRWGRLAAAAVDSARTLARAGQLRWHTPDPGGGFTGPFSPDAALREVITALRITRVHRLGWGPALDHPDGPGTASYGLLGVEQVDTAGTIGQVVLLDTGATAVPLYHRTIPAVPLAAAQ